MYAYFVRRHILHVFERLNAGDFAFIVQQFAPDAEHWFSGTHALGGKRTSGQSIHRWYGRLATVLPGIQFDVQRMAVSGPPWNTQVAVEWIDRVSSPAGEPLPNQGVFFIQLRWGRAVKFNVYCDTGQLAINLNKVAACGVTEAASSPITDVAA